MNCEDIFTRPLVQTEKYFSYHGFISSPDHTVLTQSICFNKALSVISSAVFLWSCSSGLYSHLGIYFIMVTDFNNIKFQ